MLPSCALGYWIVDEGLGALDVTVTGENSKVFLAGICTTAAWEEALDTAADADVVWVLSVPLDEAWTLLAVFATVSKSLEDVWEPDICDATASFPTTGGATKEGVDCGRDSIAAVDVAAFAVFVDNGVAAIEPSPTAEVKVSWLCASMVEAWLKGAEELASASRAGLMEVEDIEIGVEVWGASEVVITADSFMNRGFRSRL